GKRCNGCRKPVRIQGLMKNYSSSVDREHLRFIKHNSSPEQRMNWWLDALELVKESRKNRKKIKNQK
ncbi:hypothetical protein KJ652_06685, partial [Patescibacteria group bacterium]|nr:hypothetical protein [Patescibacteria group bacterium]